MGAQLDRRPRRWCASTHRQNLHPIHIHVENSEESAVDEMNNQPSLFASQFISQDVAKQTLIILADTETSTLCIRFRLEPEMNARITGIEQTS